MHVEKFLDSSQSSDPNGQVSNQITTWSTKSVGAPVPWCLWKRDRNPTGFCTYKRPVHVMSGTEYASRLRFNCVTTTRDYYQMDCGGGPSPSPFFDRCNSASQSQPRRSVLAVGLPILASPVLRPHMYIFAPPPPRQGQLALCRLSAALGCAHCMYN